MKKNILTLSLVLSLGLSLQAKPTKTKQELALAVVHNSMEFGATCALIVLGSFLASEAYGKALGLTEDALGRDFSKQEPRKTFEKDLFKYLIFVPAAPTVAHFADPYVYNFIASLQEKLGLSKKPLKAATYKEEVA